MSLSAQDGTPVRITGVDSATSRGDAIFYLKGPEQVDNSVRRTLHTEPFVFLGILPGIAVFAILVLRSSGAGVSLVLLAALFFPRLTSDSQGLIEQGITAFTEGRIREAASDFVSAEEIEGQNAALAYNQALCAYATGDRDAAVAALVRSVRLNPGSGEFRRTLELVESEYGLGSQIDLPVMMHPNAPLLVTLAMVNVTMVALGMVIRARRGIWVIVFALALVATIASGVFFFVALSQGEVRIAVVGEVGELRRIPLPEAQIWMTLPEGTTVRVHDQTGAFALIETGLGFEGWMDNRVLKATAH